MQTQQVSSSNEMTYEERLAELGKILDTHEVHVYSDRFKVNQTLLFRSEWDAREFANLLIEAGRVTHDELDDECLECYSEDDVFRNYESPVFGRGWRVMVFCRFPRQKNSEVPGRFLEFLYGHRFGAHRMAEPSSKVFVSYGGRDCDGYDWHLTAEYRSLSEAAEDCGSRYESADGPMGWSVITRDQFEQSPY